MHLGGSWQIGLSGDICRSKRAGVIRQQRLHSGKGEARAEEGYNNSRRGCGVGPPYENTHTRAVRGFGSVGRDLYIQEKDCAVARPERGLHW